MKHRAVIYSVGHTHFIYLDLSDEEAERRWQDARANRSTPEIAYEEAQDYKVERGVIEFEDEFQIWGDMGREMNVIAESLMAQLFAKSRPG